MKLNKEQKERVDFVKNEIEVLQSAIDLKYIDLEESLPDHLSKSEKNWLWDYVMNPTWNPELAEEHIFEK